MKVRIDTVNGPVTISGHVETVRCIVENDIRVRMLFNRGNYEPEAIGEEESVKCLKIIDGATVDGMAHHFFDEMTYDDINKMLENDLGWMDGFCTPTHVIEVLDDSEFDPEDED
jgi:hypothetical protein